MYRIEFDYDKRIIFVPKETADAIGSPSDVSFLYRESDATMILLNGIPQADTQRKRRGRPADPMKTTFMKSWDEEANGFKIKSYYTVLSKLGEKLPGCENGVVRGIYILEGDLCMKNALKFDLTTARLAASENQAFPMADLSGYQVIERSAYRRRASGAEKIQGGAVQ